VVFVLEDSYYSSSFEIFQVQKLEDAS